MTITGLPAARAETASPPATGSASGGQALMRLAAHWPEPIPCYAEMGSTNPLFILPGAMRERATQLAQGLQASLDGDPAFCASDLLSGLP